MLVAVVSYCSNRCDDKVSFVCRVLLRGDAVDLQVVSVVLRGQSTLSDLGIVSVVVLSLAVVVIGGRLLVVRAKLLLGVVVHHVYLRQVQLLVLQDVAARLANNTIQVANIGYVLANKGARTRFPDSVRRILLHATTTLVPSEGARGQLLVMRSTVVVPSREVHLLAGAGVPSSARRPIHNSLPCDAPCIATATLVVADVRRLHIIAGALLLERRIKSTARHAQVRVSATAAGAHYLLTIHCS